MRTAGQETVADQRHSPRPTGPAGDATVPLLASKITPADPPAALVDRPRLAVRLDSGAQGPLTLLLAPAGWGKTTLLAGWFAGRRANGTAAWLTLEPGDHGTRFWCYLHAALTAEIARRHPDLAAPPEPGRTEPEVFLPRLASAIAAQPEPVLVVLDDIHTVTDADVIRGIEFLLRHSQGQLRLVIAGRSAPAIALHRLRLTGELTEIRTAELALTLSESVRLVREQAPDQPIERIRELHTRAEGWPAGVRLASLALASGADPAAGRLPASDPDAGIAGYLRAEVVPDPDTPAHETLVRASVLDRVCGALADELTGRHDGEQQLAAAARTAAGFIVAIDGEPAWYRCHQMLADALYAELQRRCPDELPELHRRAYAWHRAHGRPVAALRHGLAIGDAAGAAELAATYWPELLLCGHEDASRTTLPASLDRAPAALAMSLALDQLEIDVHPDGAIATEQPACVGEPPTARSGAHAAGRDLTVIVAPLAIALAHGNFESAAGYAGELVAATAATGQGEAGRGHPVALALLGTARFGLGDLPGAEEALTAVPAMADGRHSCTIRFATGQLALLQAWRGDLDRAGAAAQTALASPACPGRRCASHAAAAHLALALVALHRDDLSDATRQLDQARTLAGPGTSATVTGLVAMVQAAIRHAEGDFTAVADLLGDTDTGSTVNYHAQLRRLALAETRMACGDLGGARELLSGLAGEGPAPTRQTARIALARLRLLAGEPAAALAEVPGWAPPRDELSTRLHRLDAGLVEAVATRALGDQRTARDLLEQVLDLAASDGHRRVFGHGGTPVRELLVEHLDSGTRHRGFVNDLVDAAGRRHADRHRPAPAIAEPLTERELTVLRYLQGTLSNGEIAAELFLSVNTVKTHVRNIYQKLGAPRRREAVRRARELRLL
ncbi:LuxR C-terminal-related transcriptional regulator [Micromonospora sp. NBC_01813]|uniref:LuxR C-terminal-related transcriptional regulator n=1 Tax=Micromonospora sp. NBC_01813 TaxID=2975988 RepID=UPI002DD9779B|nr:LuxR C-terminal-related transcriptional regulator [Micromonospora sp. NBC_01813]WSA10631.1 LuxR C-terminal-related transcriptional regulator [Micromonospora sp. NBC_01813]